MTLSEKQANSEQVFQKVLEDNKTSILRICRVYAVAPLAPEDLFQEVVFQIWKAFDSFKGKSSRNTWVYRIALNVCLRSKMKWQNTSKKTVQLEAIQFALAGESTVAPDQEEKYQLLKACITTLNEVDQSIMVLYLEELSYREIATITGLTENNIAVKMKRIKQRLLKCIAPKLR
jgi:RNA polymerase sigma-70 factor (ECF subfamily)